MARSGATTAGLGCRTMSLTRADGERQMFVAVNLMRWNTLDLSGKSRHHPIDALIPAPGGSSRWS